MCLLTSESKNWLAVHTDAICNTLTCITRVRTTFLFVAVVVTLFVNPKWYFVRINKTLTERKEKKTHKNCRNQASTREREKNHHFFLCNSRLLLLLCYCNSPLLRLFGYWTHDCSQTITFLSFSLDLSWSLSRSLLFIREWAHLYSIGVSNTNLMT